MSSPSTSDASVERLVTTHAQPCAKKPSILISLLEVSEGRLLGVVKALGPYLTSEQDDLRTKGVDFLATVIGRCPEKTLNRQAVKVLTAFFCDKLDDTETIVPGLKGLLPLPPICASSDALVIIKAIFAHVNMRALVQSVRFFVFSIIEGLLSTIEKSMMGEFIVPYIRLAEGEKDPRNLLLAFAIARVILTEFDPTDNIEALSNIIFCYFPITFRPPPNDPYGITSDDLRVALRRCISANAGFGPFAVPIFLEKLAAGSPAIKRDTLQTMTECIPVYGAVFLRTSARKLWNALKLEIFQPTDNLTEAAALSTTQILVTTIHAGDSQDEDVQGLARDACEECIGILREPEKSQAKPAIKILCAFMATTPSIARYTLSNVVPHLLKLYADPKEVPSRQPVLLLLSDVIAAARDSGKDAEPMSDDSPALLSYKDEVLGALISGLATPSTTSAALAGLTGLVSTPALLSDEEFGFVVLKVNEVLKACYEEENMDNSNSVLKLLMTISTTSPVHVRNQTLPLLLQFLPATAPAKDAAVARARYQQALEALSTLCGPPVLFQTFVTEVSPRLVSIAFGSAADSDSELPAAYLHAILTALKRVLSGKVDDGHEDVAGYADTLVPALYGISVRAALQGGPATEPRVVGVVGEIIRLIIQSLAPPRQQAFADVLFPAFLEEKIAPLCSPEHVSASYRFLPCTPLHGGLAFQSDATPSERNLLVLFEAGVVPLHPTVTIDSDINARLEKILLQGVAHAETERQIEAVARVIGSIVNKHVDELGPFLELRRTVYWSVHIREPAGYPEARLKALRIWTWICKGLLVRNHPLALQFIYNLFDVFENADIGTHAAKAFGDIAASDSVLTKRNSAVVKFLWSQKFATGILPRLMAGAKDKSNSILQRANLIALTALIKSVPNTAYAHEMSQLMPLLMRALDIPDLQIRADVIETLLAAAAEQKSTH
ncbi:ARM repeat-containing protein [Roridomyces roridus]|uniref:MMS19 nucleotide excision repair protein n=1 Tax=Roridomyces roridus TaxID=1738132 RepID=A0AAD7FLE0_9AGAR|nr:ARM repeat-containing protein [Roridomyces roridus]